MLSEPRIANAEVVGEIFEVDPFLQILDEVDLSMLDDIGDALAAELPLLHDGTRAGEDLVRQRGHDLPEAELFGIDQIEKLPIV